MTRLCVVGSTDDSVLNHLLSRHPLIEVSGKSRPGFVDFNSGSWNRSVRLAVPGADIPEIADNNPMVCADLWPSPDCSTTLARIALDPLVRADLVKTEPVLLLSYLPNYDLGAALGMGIEMAYESAELGSVRAATAMVEVEGLSDLAELDEVFEEAYGRSYFVRRQEGDWLAADVANQAHASYSLRITPGHTAHLLTIRVMADVDGKCGAAQAVHLLNIMSGFEETLGLESFLRS